MNEIANLIVKVSQLNPSLQKEWQKISKKSIKEGVIEPLTPHGLIQAIDRLAYEITNDGAWCALSGLPDEECDSILDERIEKMDNIVNVIALAAGIHPLAIDFVVGLRSDLYTDLYINYIDK